MFSQEPGDLVVLFTDSISESMNGGFEEWGEERLIELAKTCHGLPVLEGMRRILAAAQGFAAGAPQHDDDAGGASRCLNLHFPLKFRQTTSPSVFRT